MTSILKVTEIQDPTNSNTALTIDSAGRVSTPVKPFAFDVIPSLTIQKEHSGLLSEPQAHALEVFQKGGTLDCHDGQELNV